jgi:hypothetical protein
MNVIGGNFCQFKASHSNVHQMINWAMAVFLAGAFISNESPTSQKR